MSDNCNKIISGSKVFDSNKDFIVKPGINKNKIKYTLERNGSGRLFYMDLDITKIYFIGIVVKCILDNNSVYTCDYIFDVKYYDESWEYCTNNDEYIICENIFNGIIGDREILYLSDNTLEISTKHLNFNSNIKYTKAHLTITEI